MKAIVLVLITLQVVRGDDCTTKFGAAATCASDAVNCYWNTVTESCITRPTPADNCRVEASSEFDCERFVNCYWGIDFDTASPDAGETVCLSIPSETSGCYCTKATCGTGVATASESGCEPMRFCFPYTSSVLADTECRAYNTSVTSSDECVRSSDKSCECVPSEFCEPPDILKNNVANNGCTSSSYIPNNSNCLWKGRSKTGAPTRKPTAPTTTSPSQAGIDPVVDTVDNTGIIIGASVGAVVALCGMLVIYFCSRGYKSTELRGIISAEEYLAHARPVVPTKPKFRNELPQEILNAQGMRLRVLFDFEGENEDEITADAGDELIGLCKIEDWWEAKDTDGFFGIIPIAFVEEIEPTEGLADPDVLNMENPDF